MLREKVYFEEILFRLDSLVFYRGIKEDSVIRALSELAKMVVEQNVREEMNEKYYAFLSAIVEKAEELGISGNVFRKYAIYLFMGDENIFSLACEKDDPVKNKSIFGMAKKDMTILRFLMDLDVKNICDNIGYKEDLINYSPVSPQENMFIEHIELEKTPDKMMEQLMWYYARMGCGALSNFKMFKYDEKSGIVGIKRTDPVTFEDIIGCDYQKSVLRENTEAFLEGRPADNILLYGARGTGKSSCVKSVANEYYDSGIRLVEIGLDQIKMLPSILKYLEQRGKYFVIFIDDLSFEDFETQYKYLKSMLEGGIEVRPKNLIFYATSNRRHIISEKWLDRTVTDEDSEVHATDVLNEKLSLSDRFGITLSFPKPNPKEYVDIVVGIAQQQKVKVPEDFLKEQALKWEINKKGMSGRTARQFVNHVATEMGKN